MCLLYKPQPGRRASLGAPAAENGRQTANGTPKNNQFEKGVADGILGDFRVGSGGGGFMIRFRFLLYY